MNLFTGAGIKINEKGGTTDVCKAIEDMKKDYAEEYVYEQNKDLLKNLFKNGVSLEAALESFQNLSKEVIESIFNEVMGSKTI